MNGTTSAKIAGWEFAFGAMVLAWGLYLMFIVLPVDAGGAMTGREALPICFTCPGLWTVALGHVMFWVGSLLLLMRRWEWAMLAGMFALAATGILALVLGRVSLGLMCGLGAMAALSAAGAMGVWREATGE